MNTVIYFVGAAMFSLAIGYDESITAGFSVMGVLLMIGAGIRGLIKNK